MSEISSGYYGSTRQGHLTLWGLGVAVGGRLLEDQDLGGT